MSPLPDIRVAYLSQPKVLRRTLQKLIHKGLKMNRATLNKLIQEAEGKILTIKFVKKDGSERNLNGRFGVTSKLRGGHSTLDSSQFLTIYDVQKKDYRAINKDKVLEIHMKGEVYK